MFTEMSIKRKHEILQTFRDLDHHTTFSREAKERLTRLARRRNLLHSGPSPTTYEGYDGDDAQEAILTGLMGEWAVAIRYGFALDDTDRIDGDGGVDFRFKHKSGKVGTMDVKTIEFRGGDMLVPLYNGLNADVYYLCERRNDSIGHVGLATKNDVKSAETNTEKFPVDVKQIPRNELRDPPAPRDLSQVSADTT